MEPLPTRTRAVWTIHSEAQGKVCDLVGIIAEIASHNDRADISNDSAVEGGAQTQKFCLVEGAQAVALHIDVAMNKVIESRKQNKSLPWDTQK